MRVPVGYTKKKRLGRMIKPIRSFGMSVGLLCKTVQDAAKALRELEGLVGQPWARHLLDVAGRYQVAQMEQKHVERLRLTDAFERGERAGLVYGAWPGVLGVLSTNSWVDEYDNDGFLQLRPFPEPVPKFPLGGLVQARPDVVQLKVSDVLVAKLSLQQREAIEALRLDFERIAVQQRKAAQPAAVPVPVVRQSRWKWLASKAHNRK